MKKLIKYIVISLILIFIISFYFWNNKAKEKNIYFSVSVGSELKIIEPIIIKVNSEPIGILKVNNSNFIAEISQFLLKGENKIEINSNIDLKVFLSSDTEVLKMDKDIKGITTIKFQNDFQIKSIFENADYIDKKFNLSEFFTILKKINKSNLNFSENFYIQNTNNDTNGRSKQLDFFYEKYLKDNHFVLNENSFLVIGNKYAEIYSKNTEKNEDYILRIIKNGSTSEFKVDKISFCFINGKIQLIDFVVYGDNELEH